MTRQTTNDDDINKQFVLKPINENFVKVVNIDEESAVEFNMFILTPQQAAEAERMYEASTRILKQSK